MNLRQVWKKRKEAAGNPDVPDISPARARVAAWIDVLQRDPTAEERAAAERRTSLLTELNRTIADAPDDIPIKYVIDRLNRHWDD